MNGKKAKQLRREARDASVPTEYQVQWYQKLTGKVDKKGNTIKDIRGTVLCRGYRRAYQDLKRDYLSR